MNTEFRNLQTRLSTFGLTRRPWRSRISSTLDQQGIGEQFRAFAEVSGSLFVAFAHELSLRLDLLPLSDCVALASTVDRSRDATSAAIAVLIEKSLGLPLHQLFLVFDQHPVQSTVLTQWHRAVTLHDESVMVEIVRPHLAHGIGAQLKLLQVLEKVHVLHEDWSRLDMSGLAGDFCTDLPLRLDMAKQKHGLKVLSGAIVDADALFVAEPIEHLCGPQVLTVKHIEGRFLSTLENSCVDPGNDTPEDDTPEDDTPEADNDIPRKLCLAWMQQAFFGECFPVGARGDNLMVRNDGRFAVLRGDTSRLTSEARNNVLNYLAAASRQDPDLAAGLLIRELYKTDHADQELLRLKFRQAEPFRDGGWIPHYAGQRLAHSLFVHWRLAHRCGFQQLPHLRKFCRGLAELEYTACRLAPEFDTVQQGLDDLRVIAAAVHVREFLGPSQLVANLERLLPAGQELLHHLDEALLAADQGTLNLANNSNKRHREPSSAGISNETLGLLFVMIAVALVTPLAASFVPAIEWLEPLGVTVFLGVAGMLFWRVGKGSK